MIDIWPKLIINQVVQYIRQFHFNIPRSVNYQINGQIGPDSDIFQMFLFIMIFLGVQNLIVSDQYELQGIIDWEWSESYPICEEYFHSYKPII